MQEIVMILEYVSYISDLGLLLFLFSLKFDRYDPIILILFDFALTKLVIAILAVLILDIKLVDFTLYAFFQNSYTILYFVIGSKIYKTILNNKKVIQYGNILFVSALLINCLWFDFISEFFHYTVAVLNLIFVTYSVIFFISRQKILFSGEINNYFLLNNALFMYNACLFGALIFSDLIYTEKYLIIGMVMWLVVLVPSILLNIFLSIIIYKINLLREVKIDKK
jgi:hypothetical protein